MREHHKREHDVTYRALKGHTTTVLLRIIERNGDRITYRAKPRTEADRRVSSVAAQCSLVAGSAPFVSAMFTPGWCRPSAQPSELIPSPQSCPPGAQPRTLWTWLPGLGLRRRWRTGRRALTPLMPCCLPLLHPLQLPRLGHLLHLLLPPRLVLLLGHLLHLLLLPRLVLLLVLLLGLLQLPTCPQMMSWPTSSSKRRSKPR